MRFEVAALDLFPGLGQLPREIKCCRKTAISTCAVTPAIATYADSMVNCSRTPLSAGHMVPCHDAMTTDSNEYRREGTYLGLTP